MSTELLKYKIAKSKAKDLKDKATAKAMKKAKKQKKRKSSIKAIL